jgi:hypothetical protein
MKSLAVAVFSLMLLASCSVQTDHQVAADGTAANVSAPAGATGDCCADGGGGACCSAPSKAKAVADQAEKKAGEAAGACCGACAPDAEAKQP